jgi:GntR family transcriptional repressor for pyruvate dehydrogenase complex
VSEQRDWEVRQPRVGVADDVADQLRRRLLSGDVRDGEMLPKQEELADIYGVSKIALREALRILETEGLLEVRRGNVGGAIVHIPQPDAASYTLGLVLQARHVCFSEVGAALIHLEPVCAGLCAGRSDRRRTVLPALRAAQRELRQAIKRDSSTDILRAVRDFHEGIVNACGNETLIVLVGALETIMTSHARAAGESAAAAGNPQDPSLRESTYECHQDILQRIEHGDADGAAGAARSHLQTAGLHAIPLLADFPVDASTIKRRGYAGRAPRR